MARTRLFRPRRDYDEEMTEPQSEAVEARERLRKAKEAVRRRQQPEDRE